MEDEAQESIDYFDAPFMISFVMAALADFVFLVFMWGTPIPVVGQVLALFIGVAHYLAALVIFFLILPHLKHFIPKLVLFIALILPLPLLLIGIILALVLQNHFIEFLAEQAVIAGIGALTAGAGAVVGEAAAVAKTTGTAVKVEEGLRKGAKAGKTAGGAAAKVAEKTSGEAAKRGGKKKLRDLAKRGLEETTGGEGGEGEEEETSEEMRSYGALGKAELKEIEEGMGEEGLARLIEEREEPESGAEESVEKFKYEKSGARQRADKYVTAKDAWRDKHKNEIVAYGNGASDARAAGNEELAKYFEQELDALYKSAPSPDEGVEAEGNSVNLKR